MTGTVLTQAKNDISDSVVVYDMSRDMWFPTIWYFDMCGLRRACAASF